MSDRTDTTMPSAAGPAAITQPGDGYSRPGVPCPSWCTNPPGHLVPDRDGVVWHDRVVLDLPLPALPATEQLGRLGVGRVQVKISQYFNVPESVESMPGVMVELTSTDFHQAVLLTAAEAEQVGQALADAGRLIRQVDVEPRRRPTPRARGQQPDLSPSL